MYSSHYFPPFGRFQQVLGRFRAKKKADFGLKTGKCRFCTRADPGQDPTPKGGGVPPPPSTDPKMVVQNNGFCGRRRFCFRHMAGGRFFVGPYVSVLKILRILWRIQKWLKSTKKDFDAYPASGSDLGGWEPELMGNFFFENSLPHFCMLKMINVSWGSF